VCQVAALVAWFEHSQSAMARSRVLRPAMFAQALADTGRFLRSDRWRLAAAFAERVAAAAQELDTTPRTLGRLAGADVHVLFVESYGRALFRSTQHLEFAAWLQDQQQHLEQHGIRSASSFAFPSIRGGASSLAHAEFLSGIRVENYRVFDLLLQSSLAPLPKLLASQGYRTFNVQPAMPRPWPEGAFYGCTDVFQHDLGYRGVAFQWGLMPDQFALYQVLTKTLVGVREPVFVLYVSVSSHAPFAMIPPYLEDWSGAANPAAFGGEHATRFPIDWTNFTDHDQAEDAYGAAIRYGLRVMFGYAERLARPSLVLVLGDHQPPAIGAMTRNDSSFDVPCHVLSNQPELLRPFVEQGGVTPGLVPDAGTTAFAMSRFLIRFRRWFGGG
jgi:hypothetical protein